MTAAVRVTFVASLWLQENVAFASESVTPRTVWDAQGRHAHCQIESGTLEHKLRPGCAVEPRSAGWVTQGRLGEAVA
ncbi:hypothetical protein RIB2604_03200110 [Aspergillus luchuensis]|uniref:Uncharacterized protein n=1 Tax=Aspergillus kawachii TaxID=1069201 RepID=A0A146FXB6_ASPKA|nr:hypothetical protein RIB2604_03200110 [Aspergillus luchuensis]